MRCAHDSSSSESHRHSPTAAATPARHSQLLQLLLIYSQLADTPNQAVQTFDAVTSTSASDMTLARCIGSDNYGELVRAVSDSPLETSYSQTVNVPATGL